jgi:hypothetical protein
MIWVTIHSKNRRELLAQFSHQTLLPSQVEAGWTYKPKPDIELLGLPFTSPDDPQLERFEFISPELFPATTITN